MPVKINRPGRPTEKPGQKKRVPLNMRTTPDTRNRLKAAADKSGRSMVQEVEFRIEQSFMREDHDADIRSVVLQGVYDSFGGETKFRRFSLWASAVNAASGSNWEYSPSLQQKALGVIAAFVEFCEGADQMKVRILDQSLLSGGGMFADDKKMGRNNFDSYIRELQIGDKMAIEPKESHGE